VVRGERVGPCFHDLEAFGELPARRLLVEHADVINLKQAFGLVQVNIELHLPDALRGELDIERRVRVPPLFDAELRLDMVAVVRALCLHVVQPEHVVERVVERGERGLGLLLGGAVVAPAARQGDRRGEEGGEREGMASISGGGHGDLRFYHARA
jgi:hypothetical protein